MPSVEVHIGHPLANAMPCAGALQHAGRVRVRVASATLLRSMSKKMAASITDAAICFVA